MIFPPLAYRGAIPRGGLKIKGVKTMKKEIINAIISKNLKGENIIDFTYKNGKGKMKIDLFKLLPCPAHDFKILLDTIQIADDVEKTAAELYDYIRICINTLKEYRALLADHEKKDIASVTNEISRYINLAEKVAKRFDFEPISDAENVKMKKIDVVSMVRTANGPDLMTFPGKRFEKGGYIFHAYKEKGRYKDTYIIIPYCGIAIKQYHGPVKDAPAYIDDSILDQIKNLKNQINGYRQQFLDLLGNHPDIIRNDDININPLEKLEEEPETVKEEEIPTAINAPIETHEDIERQKQAASQRHETARRAYIIQALTQAQKPMTGWQKITVKPQTNTQATTNRMPPGVLTGKPWMSGNLDCVHTVAGRHNTS